MHNSFAGDKRAGAQPWTGHNGLFWITLDTESSRCRQASARRPAEFG
jgi:hypothetical protein